MKFVDFIPEFILDHLRERPNYYKIISNIGWLFFDKLLRMGLGLVVGVWLARYLGPEGFGQYNYIVALVSIFGVIAVMGLNDVVIKDIVHFPHKTHVTLGSAFVLQILGAIIAIGLIIGVTFFINDDINKIIIFLLALSLIFKTTDVVKYWFESQVQSKYIVWVENVVFFITSGVTVFLILNKAPLITFIIVLLIEVICIAMGLLFIYSKKGGVLKSWHVSVIRMKELLRDSWPLILSSLAIMVYMRVDQIMLGNMLGNKAVGIYSAAIRVSEVWYFIPIIIVSSVYPSILYAKKENESIYLGQLQKLYNLIVLIALIVAISMTFLSDFVIKLLFGMNFVNAGTVLSIHIWTGIFVGLGVASGKWYITEGLQSFAFYRTACGALINIVLNLILIPEYGIVGAAIATLISQIFAAYLFDLIVKKTRMVFFMKTKSLLFIWKSNVK